jgi:uncharacterized RDD family membrane protein YckC
MRHGDYAGFVTRMVAFIIDRVIVAIVLAGTVVFVAAAAQTFQVRQVLGYETLFGTTAAILAGASGILLDLVYCVGFWILAGQTPGKWIMGLLVVRMNGKRLGLGRAILRWLGYWVSGILFLGFLWILVDGRRQGFHDKLARTFVVYSRPEALRIAAAAPIRNRQGDVPGGPGAANKRAA